MVSRLPGIEPGRKPTLRDVAEGAGVSVATVSRVLNNPEVVSAKTERQVQAVIENLGFTRSAAARALNSGRSRVVGAVIPTLDHAIFARFLDALEQQLSSHGLSLVVATTKGDRGRETAQTRTLLEAGAEGLIVSGLDHDDAFRDLAARFRVPVIATSCHRPDVGYPTIGYDNALVVNTGLDHLYQLGHRRVAIVHGPLEDNDRTRTRVQTAAADDRFTQMQFLSVSLDVRGGRAGVGELINHTDGGVSAVFCMSDVLAMGVLFECKRQGIDVPSTLSVLGVDDLEWASHASPALSTIRLPVEKMGLRAADAMAHNLELGDDIEPTLLAIELVARQTTGRAP